MGGYSNSITDINNRVGIGITSPSNKLDVNGFIRTSGNIGGLLIGHGSGDYGIKIGRNRTGDGQAYLDFIGSPDPTSGTFDTRFFKNAGDNGSFQIIHNGTGNFEINTTNGADTVFLNGNVGIGTSSPGDPLTVVGKISSLGGTNNAKNVKIYANDSFGYLTTNASKIYMSTQLQVDSGLIGSYNEDLQLQVSGSTKMYINSAGNVGIGTTNPLHKLEVSGNLRVTSYGSFLNYVSATGFRLEPNQTIMFDNGEDGFCYIKAEDSSFNMEYYSAQDHYFKSGEDSSYTDIYANNFILGSDARIKENVNNLDIKPINAGWKSFNIITKKEDYRVGVIAQELEENHPEFVNTDDKGFKTVKYIDLLIAKIAELEARLEKLEK